MSPPTSTASLNATEMLYVRPAFSFEATPSERSKFCRPKLALAREMRTATRDDPGRHSSEADEAYSEAEKASVKLEHRRLKCKRSGEDHPHRDVQASIKLCVVEK